VDENGETQCQHGSAECEGNTVASCVMHLHPEQVDWFPWSVCVEAAAPDTAAAAKSCAEDQGLDWKEIEACAAGSKGAADCACPNTPRLATSAC